MTITVQQLLISHLRLGIKPFSTTTDKKDADHALKNVRDLHWDDQSRELDNKKTEAIKVLDEAIKDLNTYYGKAFWTVEFKQRSNSFYCLVDFQRIPWLWDNASPAREKDVQQLAESTRLTFADALETKALSVSDMVELLDYDLLEKMNIMGNLKFTNNRENFIKGEISLEHLTLPREELKKILALSKEEREINTCVSNLIKFNVITESTVEEFKKKSPENRQLFVRLYEKKFKQLENMFLAFSKDIDFIKKLKEKQDLIEKLIIQKGKEIEKAELLKQAEFLKQKISEINPTNENIEFATNIFNGIKNLIQLVTRPFFIRFYEDHKGTPFFIDNGCEFFLEREFSNYEKKCSCLDKILKKFPDHFNMKALDFKLPGLQILSVLMEHSMFIEFISNPENRAKFVQWIKEAANTDNVILFGNLFQNKADLKNIADFLDKSISLAREPTDLRLTEMKIC